MRQHFKANYVGEYRVSLTIKGTYVSHEYFDLMRDSYTVEKYLSCELRQREDGSDVYVTDSSSTPLILLDNSIQKKTILEWRKNLKSRQVVWYRTEDHKELLKCAVVHVSDSHIHLQLIYSHYAFRISKKSRCIQPVLSLPPDKAPRLVFLGDSVKLKQMIDNHGVPLTDIARNRCNAYIGCKCLVNGTEGRIVDYDFTGKQNIYCFAQTSDTDEHYGITQDFSGYTNVMWVTEDSIEVIVEQVNMLPDRRRVTYSVELDFRHKPEHRNYLDNISKHFQNDPKLCFHRLLKYAKDEYEESLKIFYGIAYLNSSCAYYRNRFEYNSRKDQNLSFFREVTDAKIRYYNENDMPEERSIHLQRRAYVFNDIYTFAGKQLVNFESELRKTRLFNFRLTGLKRENDQNLKLTIECNYNGLYSSDVHSYVATSINMNILALRPLMLKIFSSELGHLNEDLKWKQACFQLKTYEKIRTDAFEYIFKRGFETFTAKNKIESLLPHQSYIVDRMQKEESSNDFLTNFYNVEVSPNCHYNAISGFIPRGTRVSNGGILAMRTGWGKTVSIIELVKRNGGKTLVVAPLSLIDQWKNEFKTFAPDITLSEFYGRKKSTEGAVVFTTYGTLRLNDFTICFERVVFDESHTVKKPNSITAKSCFNIDAKNRWLLTATPFDDVLSHVQTQLKMLNITPFQNNNAGIIPHLMPFRSLMERIMFCLSRKGMEKLGLNPINKKVLSTLLKTIDVDSNVTTMMTQLSTIINEKVKRWFGSLSILKQGVGSMQKCCTDPTLLPLSAYAKRDISRELSVTKQEFIKSLESNRAVSSNFKKSVLETLQSENDGQCCICLEDITKESQPTITACLHIFCKDCIHEALKRKKSCPQCRKTCEKHSLRTFVASHSESSIQGDTTYFTDILGRSYAIPTRIKEVYDSMATITPKKFAFIKDYLNSCKNSCVIFSQYAPMLRKLSTYLKSFDINVHTVDGSTSRKRRCETFEKFTNGETKTLLLSTATASVGINLQKGGTIIFLEPMLNFEEKRQSIGRLHRIGQTVDVEVISLCSKNTYETNFHVSSKRARLRMRNVNKSFTGSQKRNEEKKVRRYLYNSVIMPNN